MPVTQREAELIRLFGAFVEYCCTDVMVDQEDVERDQSKVWYSSKPIWQYSYTDFRDYMKECDNLIPLVDLRYDSNDESRVYGDSGDSGYAVIMDINKIKVSFYKYEDGVRKLNHDLIFKNIPEMADWLRDRDEEELCDECVK